MFVGAAVMIVPILAALAVFRSRVLKTLTTTFLAGRAHPDDREERLALLFEIFTANPSRQSPTVPVPVGMTDVHLPVLRQLL